MLQNGTQITNSELGITMEIEKANFEKVESVLPKAIEEFNKRANKKGQFLNWVDLPKLQLQRIDEFYSMAENFKKTDAKYLTVLGIGGSKHTVEHMLSVNGLNLDDSIKFYSDIDSASFNRYLARIENNVLNSNFLVASKSGSTFETKDGMLRIKTMMTESYKKQGMSDENAKIAASRHFIAVTDANDKTSELRRLSDSENWLGKLFIHDDVGGRFSSFDDHALFTLAYAGMKKEDMISLLNGAEKMSEIALSNDVNHNMPLIQAAFWSSGILSGVKDSIHIYLGDMFRNTVTMHTQMENESVKRTGKSILLGAECMHHTSEAMYNPENKFLFAFTSPADNGVASENVEGYKGAIAKANAECGPSMVETVRMNSLGLEPVSAGALTQMRAFSTVYQEIIEKLVSSKSMSEDKALDSVLQPHVEFYKKNLKPIDGNQPPVLAGRISQNLQLV